MNIEAISGYAMHFFRSIVGLVSGSMGVIVLGMIFFLFVAYFFEDLRS